jgi:hypothetical protein
MHLRSGDPLFPRKKSLPPDDARVVKLASIALPANANKSSISAGIREAARTLCADARIPTGNDLHAEIRELPGRRTGSDMMKFSVCGSLSPAARAGAIEPPHRD